MYRFMIGVAVVVALLFLVIPWMVKSGSEADRAEWEAQVAAVEQEIMTALRAGDHMSANAARDRLQDLFPNNDAEFNMRYDHVLQQFNWERQSQSR